MIEPDFGDSDKESDYDQDEVANISGEESDFSSPSEDESGSDSNDDVVADDDIESIEAEAIMNYLKKDAVWAVATIRKDRLKGADKHLLAEKELKKNGCGSFDYVVEANSGVTFIRWFDNGLVQLLSNYIGNNLDTQARRWSKKEGQFINIDRPAMVVEYSSNMGGVDLCDMLMSMYQIHHCMVDHLQHPLLLLLHHPGKGKQHQYQTQTEMHSWTNVVIFQINSSDVDTARPVTHT
ncbi:hypothetical protein ACROYT_G015553 [Oculina patagonica]